MHSLNFTNSLRGDIEAFIIGAPKRFGLRRRGQRLLLNRVYNRLSPSVKHQTKIWAYMLKLWDFLADLTTPISVFQGESAVLKKNLRILIAPGSQKILLDKKVGNFNLD